MPIGLVAAGVTAAGAIGGAVITSSSQKKAASQAAASQTQGMNQQLQLGREGIAAQTNIYNQNRDINLPFVNRGNPAGEAINALLGLGGSAGSAGAPAGQPQHFEPPNFREGLPSRNDWATGALGAIGSQGGGDPISSLQQAITHLNPQQQRAWAGYLDGNPDPDTVYEQRQAAYAPIQQQQQAQSAQQPVNNALSPLNAMNNFANSAGMAFAQQEGQRALDHYAGAHGWLKSGAAMKAASDRGQKTALATYFPMYLNALQGQQATGAQSGAAIAGVGSNFGNTVSSVYGGMNNAIGNGADGISNAALLRGQANAGLGNSIGSALGGLASSFGGSGGGSGYAAANAAPWATSLGSPSPLSSLPGGFYR